MENIKAKTFKSNDEANKFFDRYNPNKDKVITKGIYKGKKVVTSGVMFSCAKNNFEAPYFYYTVREA